MTQDEYNALTDEEQNALVATEVLGGLASSNDAFTKAWMSGFFDPHNNLDHAVMGAEELNCSYRLTKSRTSLPDDVLYTFMLFIGHGETYSALTTKPNKAIMLACLKAKGIVE